MALGHVAKLREAHCRPRRTMNGHAAVVAGLAPSCAGPAAASRSAQGETFTIDRVAIADDVPQWALE
jgi:hypothetical protein